VQLTIAGNDEEGIVPELMALAARAGVSARLKFVGPVYGAQKWALFRRAGCFVLPSHSENFGNAALEAMAASCPVVVTPGVGLAPDVSGAGAGIVAAGDPASLAAAIASVLGDRAVGAAMGRAGIASARRDFSWEGVARQMVALYESIARHD
jgi:glycosyltransferase involved in cell wall biosynthesis